MYRARWPVGAGVVAFALCTHAGCSTRVEPLKQPSPPTVLVSEAQRASLRIQASFSATTVSLKEVSISARVSGLLKEQHIEAGANVRMGQLLFVIDETPFQARVENDRRLLARALAVLEEATRSEAPERTGELLQIAEAQLLATKTEENRAGAVWDSSATQAVEIQRRIALRIRAAARVQVAKIDSEKAGIDHVLNIRAAEAAVAVARSAIRQSEMNLGNCRVYSPIDGRVGEVKVRHGDLVGPAAKRQEHRELTTVQQVDPIGVAIRLESRFLGRVAASGQSRLPATVERRAVEGDEICTNPGSVIFVDNTVDPKTSTVLVKASFPNPKHALMPGEPVRVSIIFGEIQNAVVVPEQAVINAGAESTVYTVTAEGKVEVVQVKASCSYEGIRVIESGMKPGRDVMIDGFHLVRDGLRVRTEHAKPVRWPRAAALTRDVDPAAALEVFWWQVFTYR